jgi:hypothetical protein
MSFRELLRLGHRHKFTLIVIARSPPPVVAPGATVTTVASSPTITGA